MKVAKIVLFGVAALTLFSSATWAQNAMTGTGTVTTINRLQGTIAIRQTQSGTVGANTGGTVGANTGAAAEQFKLQGSSLDTLHAGDRITYTATDAGGVKTITKIEKQ
jgi:hypothetical protein